MLEKLYKIEKVMVFSRTNTHAGQVWSARLGVRPRSRDIPREKTDSTETWVFGARLSQRPNPRERSRDLQFCCTSSWFKASHSHTSDKENEKERYNSWPNPYLLPCPNYFVVHTSQSLINI